MGSNDQIARGSVRDTMYNLNRACRQGLPVFVVSSELTLNPYGFTNSDLSVPVIPKSYHDSDTSNLTGLEGNVEPNAFAAQAVIRRMIYHHHYLKTPN